MAAKYKLIFIFLTSVICYWLPAVAQTETPIDSSYQTAHYLDRMQLFQMLPISKADVVFLGNSITERGKWQEMLPGLAVKNRGIGGDNSFGILARISGITHSKPRKLFIMIGINDLFRRLPYTVTMANYEKIIRAVQNQSPSTKIYLQSVLPINENQFKESYGQGRNAMIPVLNQLIKKMATEFNLTYVDLTGIYIDPDGKLKQELSVDGVHLKPSAYLDWVNFLKDKRYL